MVSLIFRSLVHHRRLHGAVALSVAAATAVLTGALLVGDSVRGSLRELTIDRLGRIDEVLIQDRFFRRELVDELNRDARLVDSGRRVVPAVMFPHATVEHRSASQLARAGSVLVLGSTEQFWELDTRGIRPPRQPGTDEIVLNEVLATDLGVRVGDQVTLRLPQSNQVPADSPLASKNDRVRGLTGLKVVGIIPAEGLGRFNLQASQSLPRNAFVALSTLQEELDQPGKVNAMFLSTGNHPQDDAQRIDAATWLQPTLADFGVRLKPVVLQYHATPETTQTVSSYYTLTTDRMVFAPDMARVIGRVVEPLGGQPVMMYLANSIERVDATGERLGPTAIPYSMVTAIDPTAGFSPIDTAGQPLRSWTNDQLVLNQWSAEDLGAKLGDRIRIRYFAPETTHGQAVEQSAELTLAAVARLTKPARPYGRQQQPAEYDQPPTPANDPDLTPEVKGVTDQATIDDWDAPFPFDHQRVRSQDDDYWENFRTTPKALVSLAAGQKLWGSRFGQVTSYRVPAASDRAALTAQLETALRAAAVDLGFRFITIRQQQLAASRGTTPFDVLFLALSFFVIAAALLMVMLLFRLGIEQRSVEMGILLAVGMRRRRVGRMLTAEGTLVAAVGALLGVAIGVGYAQFMIAGLSSWWVGAITTPFLRFHWTPLSLALGYLLGVGISAVTIAATVAQTKQASVRRLLSGWTEVEVLGATFRWTRRLAAGCIILAVLLSISAISLGGMAQAGAFVGGGACLLAGLLLEIRVRLHRGYRTTPDSWSRGAVLARLALPRLALRSAVRNPTRSVITIGLMASATFLIVALSSFRLAPTDAGSGGFQLVAESSEPVFVDLNAPDRRDEYFGSRAASLMGSTILGLRLRAGDDASCNNLYKAAQPRVIGVTPQLVAHFDEPTSISFPWAASAARGDDRANPWRLLGSQESLPDERVAVVLDKNTAMYSLGLYRGIGEQFEFDYDGERVRFQVVGLLENSLLQGSLLIGEADFRRHFPNVSGYRYFLIAAPGAKAAEVARLCEERLGDQGFDAVSTQRVLAQLLAVQNTYLSTFQSLGALGMLLGTFGLATVQLRNVLERRQEMALLQATGYRRLRLAQLVMLESVVLLVGGLATGVFAAVMAVLPHKLLGDAAIGGELWRDLMVMLAAVMIAGLLSSLISVRAVLRLPLLASLRGDT